MRPKVINITKAQEYMADWIYRSILYRTTGYGPNMFPTFKELPNHVKEKWESMARYHLNAILDLLIYEDGESNVAG